MKREEILTVYEAIKFVDSRTAPIAELKEPVKTLEGHLNKNSGNGSQSPSIDGLAEPKSGQPVSSHKVQPWKVINSIECCYGTRCPYVNGGDVSRLLGERYYLSQRLDEMEKVMALAQAEIEKLRQENQKLKEERETLRYELKQMLGKIFKPGVKPEHDVSRPKRGAPCGHRGNSRRRPEEISEFIDIYPDKCDECGGQIKAYEKSFDEHVVEDIEIKKKVTCYRLHYGYCKQCKKVVYPKAKEAVIPGDRIGVQARAVGGYLRYLGLPYRKATKIFKGIFDLNLTHPSFLAFNAEQKGNERC